MAKKKMGIKKRPDIENPVPKKLGMQGPKMPGIKKRTKGI